MNSIGRIGLLAAGMIFTLPALGTLVPRVGFEQMVEQAVEIVHGRVIAVSTGWDAKKQFVWTHYAVEVVEVWKGASTRRIAISEPGGSLEGRTMRIAGTPVYDVGEEVVVFLDHTPIGLRRTLGWGQGKFAVERGADGVLQVRAPSPEGLLTRADNAGEDPTKNGLFADAGHPSGAITLPAGEMVRLEDFKRRVREVLGRRAQGVNR